MTAARSLRSVLVGSLVLLSACGYSDSTQPAEVSNATAAARGNDNGTELSATSALTSLTCTGATGNALLEGAVTTTGSVDSVEITAQVDGGARTLLATLQPQDFIHEGRNKIAPYSVTVSSLANGEHSLVLCFTESGSQGREPKEVCGDAISVTVNCVVEVDVCAEAAPFGDIVGNGNLCKGNGPPHVPVHVKGDFGDAPSLTIFGPGDFSHATSMKHSGESCVYQYNWDTEGNGGAGTYHFTVAGNGNTLSFDADLVCK